MTHKDTGCNTVGMARAWTEGVVDAVAAAGVMLLARLLGLALAAAGITAILALLWVVMHVGVWLAAHHPGILVLLVFLFLLSGVESSRDTVLDRLGAIHTTLLLRR